MTAYTLGMRHAFDADHLAAIDNTTRKLMADGQRPLSVGFWFSLGHSIVVFGLPAARPGHQGAVQRHLPTTHSGLHTSPGRSARPSPARSSYVIAIINLVILVGILKVFREMRRGAYDEAALEEQLNNRGFMNRILGRFTKSITKPWQMYPLGLLFGLGFDTATEVGLLALAGSAAAAARLPWYAMLCLPVIFAAGMSLLDTIDGTFMNFAYGWAFSNPVRKVFYNIDPHRRVGGVRLRHRRHRTAAGRPGQVRPARRRSGTGSAAWTSTPPASSSPACLLTMWAGARWRCGSSAGSSSAGPPRCTTPTR